MARKRFIQDDNYIASKQIDGLERIAIIGIGCRFPGGVDTPEKFWKLMIDEVDAVSNIPEDRVDVAPYYDPILAAPGKIASNQGGFLEKVDQFDASFFGVSPREANYLDPQQRLLLETAWEALEDAGQVPENLKESLTGVYMGMWANDYTDKMYKAIDDVNLYVTTGGGRYAASGRLSFFFGFQGPSLTLDTACSSSLVTVHLACQSLRAGESTLALAGGVNLILEPTISIGYSRSKMLSPDGRCKFGDAQANGYVRSEGAGIVVLKKLSDAIADKDQIYAVIRGSAVNNDGRSSELLVAPGVQSQIIMLREAYRNAGIEPSQVGYVEAHGTGTPVGDPVELEALGTVLSENRDPSRPWKVGSVKTNIGHTESASGVAGLIKAALCLKYKAIPASLHYKNPNPKILWSKWLLEIQTKLIPWPAEFEPKVAAVNSFGVTGTNAHLVLTEAPLLNTEMQAQKTDAAFALPLSAQTPDALNALAKAYLDLLSQTDAPAIQDLTYTASCRRTHHAERLAVTGKSNLELAEQLSLYLDQKTGAGSISTLARIADAAKVVFVFPGQGAQWLGMGRELLKQNQVFCETLTQCDQAFRKWADWSLLEQLDLDEDSPAYRLNEISVIQPTLFAIEVALANVWRSWGIEPAAVVGHSMGEAAAAYVAGKLSLDDAARVICKRSQLMQRTSGKGAMAVIGLAFEEAGAEIRLQGLEDQLSIAVQNSPRSTVISGNPDALDAVMEKLRAREIFCRHIKVDVASHSPQMDPLRPELVEALSGIQPLIGDIPFYSTATQEISEGPSLDAEYWGRNLRHPVRFSGTVQRLLEDNHTIFIEMSPHPILLSSIEETCNELNRPASRFASLRRNQPEMITLLVELGSLYTLGYPVDWDRLYPDGGELVSLPNYPWQRERYWFEAASSTHKQTRPGAHPLLEQYMQSAAGAHIWETSVSTKLFPYLKDHQVRGKAVFPAAAYIEMVLAAAAEVYGSKPCIVKDVLFQEALFLSDEEQLVQLVMSPEADDAAEFKFYSRGVQAETSDLWTLHAAGKLEVAQASAVESSISLSDLLSQPRSDTTGEAFYQAVSARGLPYGPNFQTITSIAHLEHGILARIVLTKDVISSTPKYDLHPVLVDASFQTFLHGLPDSNQDTYLPAVLDRYQVFARPSFQNEFWCYVVTRSEYNAVTDEILLFNHDGQLVAAASGLSMQRLEQKQAGLEDLFYEVDWQESPVINQDKARPGNWLIFADRQGVGKSLAEQLQKASHTCTIVYAGSEYQAIDSTHYDIAPSQPSDFVKLVRDVPQPIQAIIHLWSLDAEPTPSNTGSHLHSILSLTQAIAQADLSATPHLTLVTRGTQSVLTQAEPIAVHQASTWGLGAVIANEFPNLHCTRIDMSPGPSEGEIVLLAQILQSADHEDQLALRNGERYAARLKPYHPSNEKEAKNSAKKKNDQHLPFRVEVTTPGILDNMALKPVLRKSPGTGEVEIEVKATGLNFMNIMAALGILPGYTGGVGPLGIECAGLITRVGEGVPGFQIGDEVAAIAFNSLASHAVADARLVVKKPAFISFEEAASIPIAYATAYYAFHYLGRLQAGEKVLIHSATGGVGLAAIQLARRAGAEVFATAGSPEKQALLRGMGIQYVMNSRSLAFADDVLQETHGEGVDMVLNSLAGRAITRGLEILKPYGRFMEIGKRDIYQDSKVGLSPFQKNLSYFAIDLDKMSRERPDIVGSMLREIFQLVETREITPLPVQVFPVSEVQDAFRMMAQAKHIGKIVVSMEDPAASLDLPAGMAPVRSDGTYLITGGLGDLGLTFTQWLARQGARTFVLIGRSKPSHSAQEAIDVLRESGVNVIPLQADVTDRNQVAEVFAQIKQELPPLRGIIHAAGVLADATIMQMDPDRFEHAYGPKVLGAWNLHALSAGQPLDFFILFSSIAAILGTPGQANYAAGNAFLDGLARYRRAENLPATSINWGPWSEIGLANKQANRGERLQQQGLKSITPLQGLDSLPVVLGQENAQIIVMKLDAGKWCETQPAAARSSLFRDLLKQTTAAETQITKPQGKNIRDELLAVDVGRQRQVLFDTLVREQVAQVLRMAPSRIQSDKPLKTLGMDSLMSIELRNRLEETLGVSLSATLTYNYPTVSALVPFLAEKIGIPLDAQEEAPATQEPEAAVDELDNLDKDELEALLADELSAIDETLKGSGLDPENRAR